MNRAESEPRRRWGERMRGSRRKKEKQMPVQPVSSLKVYLTKLDNIRVVWVA